MSQKLGFPFLGLKPTLWVFFIGIILSLLSSLFLTLMSPPLSYGDYTLIVGILRFLGVFFVGWALLGFAVMKELLAKQRLIAFIFALMVLTVLFFGSYILLFGFAVT